MRNAVLRLLCALVLTLCIGQAVAQSAAPRVLDAFEDISPWRATGSDGVQARIVQSAGQNGRVLRLEYDFNRGAGYAVARRTLPLRFPENYEISFLVRGAGLENNLELKLTDASGENVWWSVRRNFAPQSGWQRIVVRKRHIEFAWGPTADRSLSRSEVLEFVITAGAGGAGFIEIDDLTMRELTPAPTVFPPVRATASSAEQVHGAAFAVDGAPGTHWRSAGGQAQQITLDLGVVREFGGLSLDWGSGEHASSFDVALSSDGASWDVVRQVRDNDGGADHFMLGEVEARFLRLDLIDGPGRSFSLNEARVRDLAFGASANAFFQTLAREARRGAYPRGFHGEQSYWTLVGVDGGGPRSALISEDGAIEFGRGGFSLEPFILVDDRTLSWADVAAEHSLLDGYLPVPRVAWRGEGWRLEISALAVGDAAAPLLLHRYELENRSARPRDISLLLVARPFQVNAPHQFLNTPGGFSPIRAVEWSAMTLSVNGTARVRPMAAPDLVTTSAFDGGQWPVDEYGPQRSTSEDGFANALLRYDAHLQPREKISYAFVSSLTDSGLPVAVNHAWYVQQQRATLQTWRRTLDRVRIEAPPDAARVVHSLRSSVAYMLMSRDGPALAPGTRSYSRSWIRDGAMISEGLLRMGVTAPVREYLSWYAPYQFESGKVPCCVDARGPDPVPENDSHGELIHLAALLHRYAGDDAVVTAAWPHIEAAIRYMDELRASERTPENQAPERRALYGLLPPSISHEGYSARPAYSYWDNFWGLRGYEDAAYLAHAHGDLATAGQLTRSGREFEAQILASIEASAARFDVDFIPGAADLGDFDATSTTIALAPGGLQRRLPARLLDGTFDRYWENFQSRSRSQEWRDYTPYELRVVGAFVRLGQRERANQALEFFFRDQRPHGWNHWAEVVGREVREPRFIGDMPHAWVASDYVRSALDMFAYEDAETEQLVLAAGLPEAWFETGVSIDGLATPYGVLRYSIRKARGDYLIEVGGAARPPGGFVIVLPEGRPLCVRGASVERNRIVVRGPVRLRVRVCRSEERAR